MSISKSLFNKLKKTGHRSMKRTVKTKVAKLSRAVANIRKEAHFVVIKNITASAIPTIAGKNPATDITTLLFTQLAVCGNATGNAVFPLNNTRDSSVVTSKYIELRYIIDQDNGKTTATEGIGTVQVRVMLVRCKGISGGSLANVGNTPPSMQACLAPSAAGNYTASDFYNQRADRALAPMDQNIDILYDRMHSIKLPNTAPTSYVTSAVQVPKKIIKCRHKVRYSGTSNAETNVVDGQMFLIAFTNSGEAADAHKCIFEGSIAWHYESG